MRVFSPAKAAGSHTLWLGLIVAIGVFGGIAMLPGADPASFGVGIPEVSAAANPNPLWLSERQTPPLSSVKATAVKGTAAAAGPSANIGQTVQLKGGALAPGVASFPGYNVTPVTSPLTSIKVGKKAKAAVPALAVTGDISVIPDGGAQSSGLRLQIVPTIDNISTSTVSAGSELTINGTGFDPGLRVVFPGVATPATPSQFDADSAVVTVPDGVQKGKIKVTTAGGGSNTVKLKVTSASLANRVLATDAATGLIIATDDVANTISAIDPATGETVRTVALGFEPAEMQIDVRGHRAVVWSDKRIPYTVDLDSWQITAGWSDDVQIGERGIVHDADGRDDLYQLDPQAESFMVAPDGQVGLVLSGDRGVLYVLAGSSGAVKAVHHFDGPVEGMTVGLDGRVYTIDRATGRLLSVSVE